MIACPDHQGGKLSSKLSIPLDIPDVRVLDAKMNKKGDYIITVESTINNTTRKQELRRLKAELTEAEYDTIKGAMWPFRKNQAELKPSEADLLDRLFDIVYKLCA